MNTNVESNFPFHSASVHLEKCKICGEWVNRVSLDDVLRHLDHSRDRNGDTESSLGSPANADLN
jgi:hypothetical protein